jgi:uncharacterized protein YbjT (DUF2867 family)
MGIGTVAVIGATGQTGRSLISALAKRGVPSRAITRRPGKADLPEATEIRPGDLADIASLTDTLRGATSVHLIAPVFNPREEEYGKNVIAAAEGAGVSRIVYHSVLHAPTPDMSHHYRKAMVELHLRRSELTWTVIQPAMYAQSVFAFFDQEADQLIPAFDPTRAFTPIHICDIAEAAAIIHTTEGHEYATYELAGPERIDCHGMAAELGKQLGRQIGVRKVSKDVLGERMARAAGFTGEQRQEISKMLDHYDRYGLAGNSNVLRLILGREPTDFAGAMRYSLPK